MSADISYYIDARFVPLDHPLLLIFSSVVLIAQRVCLIASDAIVVAVTIYHTYGTVKLSREANVRATFSGTLLRAG